MSGATIADDADRGKQALARSTGRCYMCQRTPPRNRGEPVSSRNAPPPQPDSTTRAKAPNGAPKQIVLEAARVVIVGALLGIAMAVLRGVPDVDAMRAEAPTSCSAPVVARPDVRWIEQADARALVEDAGVVFVDARPRDAYEAGHVAGALNVPMETGVIDERATGLVRGSRVVVTYCDTSGDCASSKRLAGLLAEAGLPDVRVLRGGMPTWLDNGYPAEAGPCRVCP